MPTMRALLENLAAFAADRLTVQERWLLVGFAAIVVLGSFVKYSRARPQLDPSSRPPPMSAAQPATDDPS